MSKYGIRNVGKFKLRFGFLKIRRQCKWLSKEVAEMVGTHSSTSVFNILQSIK